MSQLDNYVVTGHVTDIEDFFLFSGKLTGGIVESTGAGHRAP